MSTIIKSHHVTEGVNKWLVHILFVRVLSIEQSASFLGCRFGLYSLVQEPVADVALTISEQHALAVGFTTVGKRADDLFLGAPVTVHENYTFAIDLVENGKDHLVEFGVNDILIMFDDVIQKVIKLNVFKSVFDDIGQS